MLTGVYPYGPLGRIRKYHNSMIGFCLQYSDKKEDLYEIPGTKI